MLFALYFVNLVIYVTGAALLVQGGALVVRWLGLKPPVVRIVLAVAAALFAPALASLGHLLAVVPFVAFPRFYVFGRGLLPWNVGLSLVTAVTAVLIYNRRLRSPWRPPPRSPWRTWW